MGRYQVRRVRRAVWSFGEDLAEEGEVGSGYRDGLGRGRGTICVARNCSTKIVRCERNVSRIACSICNSRDWFDGAGEGSIGVG